MKEVTRIITMEITHIECVPDDKEHMIHESRSQEHLREIAEVLKGCLEADDVKIVKVQDFIQDVED